MPPDRSLRDLTDRLPGAIGPASVEDVSAAWQRYYWVAAAAFVAAGVLSMGRPVLRRHGTGPPLPHSVDSVIFEYAGWYLARGHTLYTDLWEIKPPLAHLPPYLFAHLTGSNMYAHHLLGIATSMLALVVAVTCATRVVGRVTDSPEAGLATTAAFFAHPDLFYHPWLGYDAKLAVFAFGMAALDRAVRGHRLASGVLAGLAVGFWQLAVVFPVLTTGYAIRTRSLDAVRRHVAGGLAAAAVVVVALLLYADVGGFLAEVVLGPLVLATERASPSPWTYFSYFPGVVVRPLTVAAVAGFAVATADAERAGARPLVAGAVLVVGILLVDFDGFWDTVYPLAFTALGVGVLVSYLPRRVGVAAVLVLALAVVPTFAPSEFLRPEPVALEEPDGSLPTGPAEREHVYWTPEEIYSCHFFAGSTQFSVLDYYPEDVALSDVECGNLDLYWEVTRRRLAG